MDLLAAEIRAVRGRDLYELYQGLTELYGTPRYARRDVAATPEQKRILGKLTASQLGVRELAGDAVVSALTHAPGNGASIGGIKIATERGWFAARPSGTENVYKIYAESFVDDAHLRHIQAEAEQIVTHTLAQTASS
jgi:phosphoglucomutase